MAETRFHTLLKDKVEKHYADRLEVLATTTVDYNKYCEAVGYLHGLKTALSLCEETEREFN